MLNKHSKRYARVRGWLGGSAASVLALATAASLGASPALAQEREEAGGGVETMIVTAQFREQEIQRTPLAVTAISGDTLQEQNLTNVREIAQFAPNVALTTPQASFGSIVGAGIRGIFYGDYVFSNEPVVGFYVDDVYYATMPGTLFDLLDLESVEIVRGPQAVLFGKNTIGGAIRLISKKAEGDGSGSIQATYGRFDRLDFRGGIDVPIIEDHLFMRVSGVSKEREGYQRQVDFACAFRDQPALVGTLPIEAPPPSCDVGTFGGENVRAGRIALRAIVSPDIEANIYADVLRDRSRNEANTLIGVDPVIGPNFYLFQEGVQGGMAVPRPSDYPGPGFPPFLQNGNPYDQRFIPADMDVSYANFHLGQGLRLDPHRNLDSWGTSGTVDWSIRENLRFKSITGFRTYDWQISVDDDTSPIATGGQSTFLKSSQFSQEGRFTGELFNDRLEWTVGGFYLRWQAHQKGPVVIGFGDLFPFAHNVVFDGLGNIVSFEPVDKLFAFVQNDKAVGKSYAGYAHADFAVTDALHVFGGYRYSHESKSYRFDHLGAVPGQTGCFDNDAGIIISLAPGIFIPIPGPNIDECHYLKIDEPSFFKFNISDWRLGINYQVTDDVMVYGQVSTGYRASGLQSRPFTAFQFLTGAFGPERAKAYEVGVKSQWFENRLTANVALFYTDYNHRQVPLALIDPTTIPPSPFTKTENIGTGVIQGIEIELQAQPIRNFLISANWGYIETEQTPSLGAAPGFLDVTSTLPVGSPFGGPKHNVGMRASYRIELGDNVGALTPAVNFTHRSGVQTGSIFFLSNIEAVSIADGYLTWEAPAGDWTVLLQVTNMLDHRFFDSKFDLLSFGGYELEGHPNRPREWAVTVRKTF